jgi:hypothetical protein
VSESDEIRKKAVDVLDGMIKNGHPTWKPGQDVKHLRRRIEDYGHLPDDYTLEGYNKLIMDIISDTNNETYLYYVKGYRQNFFVFGDRKWIVMVGEDGVMETAFPPDVYEDYLIPKKGYNYLGTIKEVRGDEYL